MRKNTGKSVRKLFFIFSQFKDEQELMCDRSYIIASYGVKVAPNGLVLCNRICDIFKANARRAFYRVIPMASRNLRHSIGQPRQRLVTYCALSGMYVERTKAISGHQPGFIDGMIGKTTVAFRQLKSIFEARFAVATADNAFIVPEFQQTENEWSMLSQQYNDAVTRYAGNGTDENKDAGVAA